uniref:Uncharacterized protein n=1 Tax=Timema douglasi TaxID=61478 RepID=A0A7R8VC81_TIMDO|nr:unnamed protein product [Timema douglasi]
MMQYVFPPSVSILNEEVKSGRPCSKEIQKFVCCLDERLRLSWFTLFGPLPPSTMKKTLNARQVTLVLAAVIVMALDALVQDGENLPAFTIGMESGKTLRKKLHPKVDSKALLSRQRQTILEELDVLVHVPTEVKTEDTLNFLISLPLSLTHSRASDLGQANPSELPVYVGEDSVNLFGLRVYEVITTNPPAVICFSNRSRYFYI